MAGNDNAVGGGDAGGDAAGKAGDSAGDDQANKAHDAERPGGTSEANDSAPAKPLSPQRKRLNLMIGGVVVVLLIAGGVAYWLHSQHYESTDDAFIDSDQSQIASQISGRVVALLVADNQHVEKDQPLLRIDRRDYEVKLEQSEAQVENAVAQVAQGRADLLYQQANLAQQTAQVRVAEADLTQAKQDLARYTGTDPAAITRQQLEQSQASTKSAFARLDSAKEAVQAGQAQVVSQKTKIDAAQAQVKQYQADVDNAKLH